MPRTRTVAITASILGAAGLSFWLWYRRKDSDPGGEPLPLLGGGKDNSGIHNVKTCSSPLTPATHSADTVRSSLAPYKSEIEFVSGRTGIPAAMIAAVIMRESMGRNGVEGDQGRALGLMQISTPAAEQVGYSGTRENLLKDSRTNILYGTLYLKDKYRRYGNFADAAAAYNSGTLRLVKVKCGGSPSDRRTATTASKTAQLRSEGWRYAFNVGYVEGVLGWLNAAKVVWPLPTKGTASAATVLPVLA